MAEGVAQNQPKAQSWPKGNAESTEGLRVGKQVEACAFTCACTYDTSSSCTYDTSGSRMKARSARKRVANRLRDEAEL